MQTYTRQQRQGRPRFGAGTLVGNWSEDVELQGSAIKEFLIKRDSGMLKSERYRERMAVALAEVPMTRVREDPYVHFGDVLQLAHVGTGNLLAVDVEAMPPVPGEMSCSATATAQLLEPVARNTLLITQYIPPRASPLETLYPGDVLRYGQKIRVLANPMAQGDALDADGGSRPLALYSRSKSLTHVGKYSGNQLVGFTWRVNSYDTVWQVQAVDPSDRLISEGLEVAVGAPIMLVHCTTGQPLNLEEGVKAPNDFGTETEVSAHSATTACLPQALEAAVQGNTTRVLPKTPKSSTCWAFLAGQLVAELPPGEAQVEASDAAQQELLQVLVDQINAAPGSLSILEQKLRLLVDANGSMEVQQLQLALKQVGCPMTEEQLAALPGVLVPLGEVVTGEGAIGMQSLRSSTLHGQRGSGGSRRVANGYALLDAVAAAVDASQRS